MQLTRSVAMQAVGQVRGEVDGNAGLHATVRCLTEHAVPKPPGMLTGNACQRRMRRSAHQTNRKRGVAGNGSPIDDGWRHLAQWVTASWLPQTTAPKSPTRRAHNQRHPSHRPDHRFAGRIPMSAGRIASPDGPFRTLGTWRRDWRDAERRFRHRKPIRPDGVYRSRPQPVGAAPSPGRAERLVGLDQASLGGERSRLPLGYSVLRGRHVVCDSFTTSVVANRFLVGGNRVPCLVAVDPIHRHLPARSVSSRAARRREQPGRGLTCCSDGTGPVG